MATVDSTVETNSLFERQDSGPGQVKPGNEPVEHVEIGSGKDLTVCTIPNSLCASRGLEKLIHCRLRRS